MKPDSQLYEDIQNKLDFLRDVDYSDITFSIRKGTVKIEGIMGSYKEKQLLRHAILQISGVKDIIDKTQVEEQSELLSSGTLTDRQNLENMYDIDEDS